MTINNFLPLTFLSFFFLFSCTNEPNEGDASFEEAQLFGRWEIVEAFRNGKKTQMLTGTFYEFGQDGQLATNFPPSFIAQEISYQFDGQAINAKGGEEMTIHVENLNDTTLTMNMMVQKFPFRLVLERAVMKENVLPEEEGILQ